MDDVLLNIYYVSLDHIGTNPGAISAYIISNHHIASGIHQPFVCSLDQD